MTNKYKREQELISHYDDNLDYYSPLKNKSYFDYMCNTLGVDLSTVGSVLDLGCGDGRLCESLGDDIVYMGVDYSEKRIHKASNKYKNHNFKVSCIHEFCESQTQYYDLAVLTEVLEHIETPYTVIEQLLRYNADIKIIATVPINMPYKAHLSVWKTIQDVTRDLKPDKVQVDTEQSGRHFLCAWGI